MDVGAQCTLATRGTSVQRSTNVALQRMFARLAATSAARASKRPDVWACVSTRRASAVQSLSTCRVPFPATDSKCIRASARSAFSTAASARSMEAASEVSVEAGVLDSWSAATVSPTTAPSTPKSSGVCAETRAARSTPKRHRSRSCRRIEAASDGEERPLGTISDFSRLERHTFPAVKARATKSWAARAAASSAGAFAAAAKAAATFTSRSCRICIAETHSSPSNLE
mmetsp:Transcript_18949/g.64037  ORF Transcript_18949/g.64037 Transcript_18949/m.64037 type:complete len:228 (-) Transcript_18949:826-1509(-)